MGEEGGLRKEGTADGVTAKDVPMFEDGVFYPLAMFRVRGGACNRKLFFMSWSAHGASDFIKSFIKPFVWVSPQTKVFVHFSYFIVKISLACANPLEP